MQDFLMIVAVILFFALTFGLLALCERLMEQTP